jgi:hypothetical protein
VGGEQHKLSSTRSVNNRKKWHSKMVIASVSGQPPVVYCEIEQERLSPCS